MHLYEKFVEPLPEKFEEYRNKLNELFPVYVFRKFLYDTCPLTIKK